MQKFIKSNYLFYGGLLVLAVLYLSNFNVDMSTDDGWFMNISREYSFFGFLQWRYNNWSARLFPEAMLYLIFLVPLFVHHLISACAWLLYSYSLVRIFVGTVSRKNFLVAFLSLGFINVWVMKDSIFWITGAINYLWPLALGVFALIPYADHFFRNKKTSVWLYLVPALIFSFSNEQLIACVIGVVIVYHGAMLIKKRKENYFLYIPTTFFVIGFTFMFLAPGNKIRMQQEIDMWMSDFNKLSPMARVLRGSSWLFEGWQTKLLLLFIVILAVSLAIGFSKLLAKVVAGYTVFLFLLLYNFPNRFTNFRLINEGNWIEPLKAGNLLSGTALNAVLPYIVWGLFFGLVAALSISVSKQKIFIGLSYSAALFSSILMWFSPTMYASGARVFMCSSIFLLVILFILYQQVQASGSQNEKKRLLFYGCFIPVINFMFVLFLN
ncbi:hypothetical protein IGL98_002624 [Enterococcus sp. DIV0840]|uniref:DUF6056 family protein n=1 Tax=Enterococcus TaxID=1350 RepID=UPI001A8E110F|nr:MULTISPECIES: DUF6056 family protein [Enterococcus]MBO0434266.1 hypothetical protein [Enterococcus sp. DIV0849a]MBO0473575.1 hypothetical protein [Enterococcus ureasiticus]